MHFLKIPSMPYARVEMKHLNGVKQAWMIHISGCVLQATIRSLCCFGNVIICLELFTERLDIYDVVMCSGLLLPVCSVSCNISSMLGLV